MSSTDTVTKKRRIPPAKGGSRKGIPNKVTAELKDMIRQSLEEAGGVDYLRERAKDPRTASAYLSLLGKILPMQLTGAGGRTLAQELAGLKDEDK